MVSLACALLVLELLNDPQHDWLLRAQLWLYLVEHSHALLIGKLWPQNHHIPASPINQFVVGGFYICHDVAEVAVHPAHNQS